MKVWLVEKIEISDGSVYADRKLFLEKDEKAAKKYYKRLVDKQKKDNRENGESDLVYDVTETDFTCYEDGRAAEWRVDISVDLMEVTE